jgi:hypothetical protein
MLVASLRLAPTLATGLPEKSAPRVSRGRGPPPVEMSARDDRRGTPIDQALEGQYFDPNWAEA